MMKPLVEWKERSLMELVEDWNRWFFPLDVVEACHHQKVRSTLALEEVYSWVDVTEFQILALKE